MIARLICAVGACALATAALAQTPAEQALLKAEDQLLQAEARHDVAAIDRGFADEAIFVHGNGRTETKAEYLADQARANGQGSIEAADRTVRLFGEVGVVRGKLNVTVGELHLPGLYLAVYVRRDGRWQMLDWQTSPVGNPGAK